MEAFQPSLWQLRVFEAVARLESFTQAAAEVLRTQPAVTASVLRLEQGLGSPLFYRSPDGILLTPGGGAMVERSRAILAAAEQAARSVGAPAASATGITRAQMRALVTIDQAGSFQAAATRLGISTASLHRAARQLEQTLRVTLYRPRGTGMATTAEGAQLARQYDEICRRIETLVEEMRQSGHLRDGFVDVGVQLLDPNLLLSKAVLHLCARRDDIRVRVIYDRTGALVQRLRNGSVGFIFGALSETDFGPDIVEEPVGTDEYCVVARTGHPLTEAAETTLADLRRYDWVLPPRGTRRHVAFEQMFGEDAAPRALIETHSLPAARLIVAESDMLMLLSRIEVLEEHAGSPLTVLPFRIGGQRRVLGFTRLRDWTPGPDQAALMAALREVSARYCTPDEAAAPGGDGVPADRNPSPRQKIAARPLDAPRARRKAQDQPATTPQEPP